MDDRLIFECQHCGKQHELKNKDGFKVPECGCGNKENFKLKDILKVFSINDLRKIEH